MPEAPDQSSAAVFDRMRRGILDGSLRPGARLPPSRRLAAELGLARQTVVAAYERLTAEGYARARVGCGTFVATDLPDEAPPPARPPAGETAVLSRRGAALAALPATAVPRLEAAPAGLLAPGVPAPELFPAVAWARTTARVLRRLAPESRGYPSAAGWPALREAIAGHLAATRGLIVEPDRIVVTAGTQQALRLAAELLLDPGDAAWVEEPGYIAGRGALRAAGARLVAVPSDAEGIDVAAGLARAPAARLALVAPSHATPLGGALPVGRRLALLDWAARAGAWVIEDDADSEFRWQGRPLPPLATLDSGGRVLYCGTFSKALAPALRLGFVVLPAPLVRPFLAARLLADRGIATLPQAVLAAFLASGQFAAHVRRMRTEYAARRAALLAALARYCPAVTPLVAPGGLHLVLRLPAGAEEGQVRARARELGLSLSPLAAYYQETPAFPGLVCGFAATPAALAAEAARRLAWAVIPAARRADRYRAQGWCGGCAQKQ